MLFRQNPAIIPGINPHYYAIDSCCVYKEICIINKMQNKKYIQAIVFVGMALICVSGGNKPQTLKQIIHDSKKINLAVDYDFSDRIFFKDFFTINY